MITRSGSTVNFRSGTTFINAATTTNSGTNTFTGANATISSSVLRIDPFITYSKCGLTTVDAESTTTTFAVAGLVATDAVFAMTAEDTANAVVRAFVDTPGSLKIVVSGAVTADNSDGMKVSWYAIRPQ